MVSAAPRSPSPAAPKAATDPLRQAGGPLTQLFGFAQYDLPGTLAVADGRYLARDAGGGEEGVLVVETLAAAALPGRRRRRPQAAEPDEAPPGLPLSRATAVRVGEPFSSAEEAERWLTASVASEDVVDAIVAEGIALLNRALFAQGAAAADPRVAELSELEASAVRIGYGSGEEVAAGRYTAARHVDVQATGASRRSRRAEELRPQERVAAVLGRRERIDACEALLLRARADLDAGRSREAALQLRIGLEALLVELAGALADPAHAEDMAELGARRGEVGRAADTALRGDLDTGSERRVRETLEICERVLRRRRVLRGG
jgi:hypothetical protein